ncbi:MAG: DivIVA domain-containing protein [candidate division NC10 bacterium]|nr:DivIVA domain-containing protein [candidate division NC10 bacterium]
MEISPLEITQREFARKFRGLDPEEVQTFLEQIAEEMTRLVQETTEQAAQIQRLEAQVRVNQEREESLRNTLVTAQKITEDMKANAKREADLIVKEGELNAERLLEQAHRKLAQVQAEVAELIRQRDLFAAKLRAILKTHLELLEAQPARPVTPGAPTPQPRPGGGTPGAPTG